jgi:hypothetical protein
MKSRYCRFHLTSPCADLIGITDLRIKKLRVLERLRWHNIHAKFHQNYVISVTRVNFVQVMQSIRNNGAMCRKFVLTTSCENARLEICSC